MPIRRCPHCNIPLTDQEAAQTACPACGQSFRSRLRRSPRKSSSTLPKVALALSALVGIAAFIGLRSLLRPSIHKITPQLSIARPVLVQSRPSSPPPPTTLRAQASPPTPPDDGFKYLDLPNDDRVFKSLSSGQIIKLAGRLRLAQLAASALLQCRTSSPNDPQPRLEPGPISPGAIFQKIR